MNSFETREDQMAKPASRSGMLGRRSFLRKTACVALYGARAIEEIIAETGVKWNLLLPRGQWNSRAAANCLGDALAWCGQ
jgi:hypothetical protein